MSDVWTKVDDLVVDLFGLADPVLDAALAHSAAQGLPPISVSAAQGRLLELVARSVGARRVLEVGTLGGYSATWLARGLGEDGFVVTLEFDPHHAEVARANLSAAGLASRVSVRVGPAAESMRELAAAGEVFDLVFIDADKEGYPEYLRLALELSRPGTVILADNVVRAGAVADDSPSDPRVAGVREFLALAGASERVAGTVVQTVGAKGYDGFAYLVVTA